MVKKKVDSRIRTIIENGVKTKHRTMIVIIGDHGRDQVVNLHYMLSKCSVSRRPSVLWCYKKELGFTSHRQKRMRKIKRDMARGIRSQEDGENPFELFVGSTDIRYCYYKETHKILGQTFGMCVLQDFQALTPNLLARTIETVEGGGIIILLLKSITSLQQLYTMSMDVHSRFRTESHQDVVARFNERFLLSLANNPNALVVDDELNVLPISSHIRAITKVSLPTDENGDLLPAPSENELKDLKLSLNDTPPVGQLVECTRTIDQAKAVLTFMESISEKTLRSTVVLTAGRGRGKSSALGLSIAGAVAFGYSNIFVTAPSPENLKTLFEMIFKGFDALEYKEHQDYEVIQSTNPDFNKAVVRVNIFHTHRQTIQYIQPNDYQRLGQAELLCIDEAAAIPLPVVKNLLGPYLVFMSSTINGYEGTGRSLSLKLVKQLRTQSAAAASTTPSTGDSSAASVSSPARTLREVALEEPIRYAKDDPIEAWLNELLCLNCTANIPKLAHGIPHPNSCDLYYVERDTLFSYHKTSEQFLQRMMSLYVSSHYKNSPNDLQLMSDAPAHHLFVLLGPVTSSSTLPDILVVIQVCLEGAISKESVLKSLSRGERASGDLIPWCISQQYQNNEFAGLSGARIVRIATHPELNRMGYASRALDLLCAYYEGKVTNISEFSKIDKPSSSSSSLPPTSSSSSSSTHTHSDSSSSNLLNENVTPRKSLPPLLTALGDRRPELLHYIGTSYGLTQDLFNFWKKSKFTPLYLRLTANDLTGEHTCIMLKALQSSVLQNITYSHWLDAFSNDFQHRFVSLLSYNFKSFQSALAMSVLMDEHNSLIESGVQSESGTSPSTSSSQPTDNSLTPWTKASDQPLQLSELMHLMTEFDLRRLESYANNLVDYHMILDLIPTLARLFFLHRFSLKLSFTQCAVLVALGLQHKDVADVERELGLASQQILAQFNKTMRKMATYLRQLEEKEIRKEVESQHQNKPSLQTPSKGLAQPLNISLNNELNASGTQVMSELKKKQKEMLESMNLEQYAIGGSSNDWDESLNASNGVVPSISIKADQHKVKQHREYLKNKTDSSQKKRSHSMGGAQQSAKKNKR